MDVVVACDERGGIAFEDKLPWHLPEDLAFFRDITQDQVIVMGRKTYDAMPKSISHERTSIVFSRREQQSSQVHFVTTMEQCLDVVQRFLGKRVCVIGGQDIFELFLD
ncbi:MAG TPA: dihydrofolate reductase, partial [Chlamydiales bacterium]|nr:dihydrofolate reductase [Chlamydiales bacterium]